MSSKYLDIKHKDELWLRLDNAAKIYPAVQDMELTSVFRITVELKAGFFWYYLEHKDSPVAVEVEQGTPCRSFDKSELMFRVLVKENRISVEFSHILTDATGAFEFLKSLLFVYIKQFNLSLSPDLPFYNPAEKPS